LHVVDCRRGKLLPKFPDDVVVLDVAYHGHTQSVVDISPYKWRQVSAPRRRGRRREGIFAACLPACRARSLAD
jgi:hypothetical protein